MTTTTSEIGEFRFAGLGEGKYTLAVAAPGFKRLEAGQVLLSAGEVVRIELLMEVTIESSTIGIMTSPEPLTTPTIEMIRKLPLGDQ